MVESSLPFCWRNQIFNDHNEIFKKSLSGVATSGEVCNGYNSLGFRGGLSVVEDHGFLTWGIMAHELAHKYDEPIRDEYFTLKKHVLEHSPVFK